MKSRVDEFLRGFLEAALWAGQDDCGDPLDGEYGVSDIAPESLTDARTDCEAFYWEHSDIFANDPLQGGIDFYLTRNRHGSGYWDGGWGEDEDVLTRDAHAYGTWELEPRADRKLYHHGRLVGTESYTSLSEHKQVR